MPALMMVAMQMLPFASTASESKRMYSEAACSSLPPFGESGQGSGSISPAPLSFHAHSRAVSVSAM